MNQVLYRASHDPKVVHLTPKQLDGIPGQKGLSALSKAIFFLFRFTSVPIAYNDGLEGTCHTFST